MALGILLVAVFAVPTSTITQQQLYDHNTANAQSHVLVTGERITDPSKSQANGNQKFITVRMDCPPECAKPNAKINLHLWSTAPKFQEICGHSSIHLPSAAAHGSRDPPDSDSPRDHDDARDSLTPQCTPPDHSVDPERILHCLITEFKEIIERQSMEQQRALDKASSEAVSGDSREFARRREMSSSEAAVGDSKELSRRRGSESDEEESNERERRRQFKHRPSAEQSGEEGGLSEEESEDGRRMERDRRRPSKHTTSAEQREDEKRRHSEYSASWEQSEEESEDERSEEGGRRRSSEDRTSAEHRERRESEEEETETGGNEEGYQSDSEGDRGYQSEDRASADHSDRRGDKETQRSESSDIGRERGSSADVTEHVHRQIATSDVEQIRHLIQGIKAHDYEDAFKHIEHLKSVLEPMRGNYGNLVSSALWMLKVVEDDIFPHKVHHDIERVLELTGGEFSIVKTATARMILRHLQHEATR